MKKFIVLGSIVAVISGCTYPLTISNENAFPPVRTNHSQSMKIGFLPSEDRLLNAAMEEVSFNSNVTSVKKNYQIGSGSADVDYVCGLSQEMKFRSSGENFIITFPGFILFAHSWAGYKYFIDIDTQSKLMDKNGNILNETTIKTPFEIRYTSYARGAASSLIGWLTPGFGLLDIIPGGIFASSYDQRATPEFLEKVKPSYRAYVASKVLEQIATAQEKTSSSQNQLHEMEAVLIGDEIDKGEITGQSEDLFKAYTVKVEDGRVVSVTDSPMELPREMKQTLDQLIRKQALPDEDHMKQIFRSFGITENDIPGNMSRVAIYTLQDDRVIALYQGNEVAQRMARK